MEPEIDQSISWIRQIAARRIPVEIVEETEEHIVELHHTPLGVTDQVEMDSYAWSWPLSGTRDCERQAIYGLLEGALIGIAATGWAIRASVPGRARLARRGDGKER